jgi:hypothetical protein
MNNQIISNTHHNKSRERKHIEHRENNQQQISLKTFPVKDLACQNYTQDL